MGITKERINKEIVVDWFADANYQDDGAVDFALEETDLIRELFEEEAKTKVGEDGEINAYVTVERDGSVFEIELCYRPAYGNENWQVCDYQLNDTEAVAIKERLKEEVGHKFARTLDQILAESIEESKKYFPQYWD